MTISKNEYLICPCKVYVHCICKTTLKDFAEHINSCYSWTGVTEADLQDHTARSVYDSALWLAIKDNQTDEVIATGIAELDKEIGEGVLGWIQVSEQHRGYGLGKDVVSELLWRMKENTKFATVSGQCNNSTNPEAMYCKFWFEELLGKCRFNRLTWRWKSIVGAAVEKADLKGKYPI